MNNVFHTLVNDMSGKGMTNRLLQVKTGTKIEPD